LGVKGFGRFSYISGIFQIISNNIFKFRRKNGGKRRNGYKAKPRRQLRKREPRKFEKGRESIARNDP